MSLPATETACAAPLRAAATDVNGSGPSTWRAWFSLVLFSLRRQSRSKPMVWLALGLLGFAVLLVTIQTRAGKWGMDHWRHPRGRGPTLPVWVDQMQAVLAATNHSPAGNGIESAVLGSLRVYLSPTARPLMPGPADATPAPPGETGGRELSRQPLAASAFQIFSRWVVFSIFLSFLLPVWSLSFATEAIGGEREANSLIWLLTRPLPRPAIYLAKFAAVLPWSLGLCVGGFALMCAAGGAAGWRAFQLFWPAVFWATLAFTALFFLIGAVFRRPAVVAILYSFFLETLLGNMPGYLKRVSIGFYTRCMMFDAAQSYGIEPEKPGVYLPVDGATAWVALVGLTVGLLAVGMIYFSRAEYHETP